MLSISTGNFDVSYLSLFCPPTPEGSLEFKGVIVGFQGHGVGGMMMSNGVKDGSVSDF